MVYVQATIIMLLVLGAIGLMTKDLFETPKGKSKPNPRNVHGTDERKEYRATLPPNCGLPED